MSHISDLFTDIQCLLSQVDERQKDADLYVPSEDIAVIRELAKQQAEIASMTVHKERKKRWTCINSLEEVRPTVWFNEICWDEMNVNDELTIRCKSEIAKRLEIDLRKTLYKWKHMQGDMIVESKFYSPVIFTNSGFGISAEEEKIRHSSEATIASHHYNRLINSEEDIEKITVPEIVVLNDRTEAFFNIYNEIFDGILDVEKRACTGFWMAPWDDICTWFGAEDLLINLALEPDFMHKIIERVTNVYIKTLDKFEQFGLLADNATNVRVGSGGYGYVRELPAASSLQSSKIKNMWGMSAPQIFASISPAMHEEFGVDYERRILERFGLSYYGCCEPLDRKIDILSKISNLRKISISPWANAANAAEPMKGRYVVSLKPPSAVFAAENWDPEWLRSYMETQLTSLKGCCVEIIFKDVSTVHNQPQRLWEAAEITGEVLDKLY